MCSSAFSAPEAIDYDQKKTAIERYFQEMNMEVYGTSDSCEAVGGVYSLAVNNRYRKVRISFLERSFVWQVWKPEYKAILRVETLNHKNEAEFSGLLIRTSAGWTLGLLNVNNTHPYPTISFETSVGVAFNKYFQFQQDNQSGINFYPLKFNRDRTEGRSKDIELSYLDYESGKDFFELHSNPFSYDPPAVFFNPDTQEMGVNINTKYVLRVPNKMYEMQTNPEFAEAKESRKYTKMLDLMYEQSLQIARGDMGLALYFSFISSNMHARGACGAINGLRGHTIVPKSLFDNEMFEGSMIDSRQDSLQHFWALAFFSHRYPKSAVKKFGELRETLLESMSDSNEENVQCQYKLNLSKIEGDKDILYNDIGLRFIQELEEDNSVRPSDIINSPEFDDRKMSLGIGPDSASPWVSIPSENMVSNQVINSDGKEITIQVSSFRACNFTNPKVSLYSNVNTKLSCASAEVVANGEIKITNNCSESVDLASARLVLDFKSSFDNTDIRFNTYLNL